MFSNHRKTIGVFVESAINEFSNKLCQGVISEAEKKGYNVAIFTPYGNYGENERYFKGDNQLYHLPPYEDFDGVIVALDTMQKQESRQIVLEHIKNRCHCPVISVRELVENANNFFVDNSTCMEGIIRHFVEEHGFTRLCFMSGPESHWDAVERMECFKRVMAEYQLPVGEHQLFYGDYWKNKGGEACDWFLEGQQMPQAIICANDYMATAVASELIRRGIRIPEEICVSGYDGMEDALKFTPSITTMSVPFYEMGRKAVAVIEEKQETPEQVQDYYFDIRLMAGESCGCMKENGTEIVKMRRDWHEEAKVDQNRQMQFHFLTIHLSASHTISEMSEHIQNFILNIEGIKDYCVCFCEDLKNREDFSDYSDTMEMRIGMRNGVSMGHINIPFDKKELLPSEITDEGPQIWYFTPLHFQDKTFGYEATSFMTPEITGNLYLYWNIIIGKKIQDTLIYHQMQNLIVELENLYDRDSLTGMYNRRGLEDRGGKLFEEAREEKKPLFLSIIDLDGMKQINDNHGHVEGDYALKMIQKAISTSCREESIQARSGGDEFVVIGKDIDESEGAAWMEGIDAFLTTFNQSGKKKYDIHASYGYVCRIPGEKDSMETYIKESDEIMYKNKIENKKRRNEPLR
ncbi:MAG: GGDEF domain-containing protein [Lachnospiraceae bacterium]|nr:GGDEF domain-containing protein [Lachnospiraceae bacterium]